MRRFNLADPELESREDRPDGFRSRRLRLGPALGAEQLGATLYALDPGQAVCPYHYEHGEEEWLLVLDGTPTVRHPDGCDRLQPLDVVCFPRGPEGAHQVLNDGDEVIRVLMFSSIVFPTVTVYPDSDKVGVYTENEQDDLIVRRSSGVDYYEGEI